LTGVVIAAIAALALWFAWRQVREMQDSTRKQADSAHNLELQTRANVLLTLDERWETEPMLSVRRELQLLRLTVESELSRSDPSSATTFQVPPAFAGKLDQLLAEDFEKYLRLYRIWGFFETVGYAARAGYVPIDEVINLLGGSILETGRLFRPHIQRLKESPTGDPRMYEHFLWLFSNVEKLVSTSLASV
jgi:hypothetical protein